MASSPVGPQRGADASARAPQGRENAWVAPAVFVGGLVAALCAGLAPYLPSGPIAWVCVVVSALAAAGTGALTVWTRPSWRLATGVSAVVLLVALVVVGRSLWLSSRRPTWGKPPCSPVDAATVLTSPDLAATSAALARMFVLQHLDRDSCPRYQVYVRQASRELAGKALSASGWEDPARMSIGAPPGLWIADRATDVERLRSEPAAAAGPTALTGGDTHVIAHSPLVLAVPTGPSSLTDGLSWRQTVQALAREKRWVVRPEPGSSQVGDLALLLDYPPSPRTPEADRAHESVYARGFAASGWRRDDLSAVLRDARPMFCPGTGSPQERGPAVVVPQFVVAERSALDEGIPSPAAQMTGCSALDDGVVRTVRPRGAEISLELAVTRLQWSRSGPSPGQNASLARFTAWLIGPNGSDALAGLGWERGQSATASVRAGDLQRVESAYRSARNAARLQLAVDASRSMRVCWPMLTQAVERVLPRLGPGDEVGLSTFVAPSGAGSILTPRVRMAQVDPRQVTSIGERLEGIRTTGLQDGDTPLGEALTELVDHAGAGATVVVITDGRDLTTRPDWSALQEKAFAAGVEVVVVVLGPRADVSAGMPGGGNLTYLQVTGGDAGQQLATALSGILWRPAA